MVQQDSPTTDSRQPIFEDLDIPCPHCQYNLRGLVEARCPECGEFFDPDKVLHDFREAQPPLPILWVLRRIYPHPVRFWQMPEVRRSQGPRRWQLVLWLLMLPAVAATFYGFVMHGAPRMRSAPMQAVRAALVLGSMATLALYAIVLVHGILCRVVLERCGARQGVRAAKEVVGYGLAWFAPVLAGTTVALAEGEALFVPGSSLTRQAAAVAGATIVLLSCGPWMATLYQGGRFASGGSLGAAIWCVMVNPFWYILGLICVIVLHQ